MERVSLQGYYESARRAYYWTSFSPDERAKSTIQEHENELNGDLDSIPAEEHPRYIENYKKYFSAWLHSRSNCASTMITGASGFNSRRAEKANQSADNRMKEFIEWRERALKAIKRKVEKSRPQEEKLAQEWEALKRDISSSAQTIIQINNKQYPGSKALFVSSIFGKVETFAKRGEVEIVKKAIELIREYNSKSSIITERHQFFKLAEVAQGNVKKAAETTEKESEDTSFKGGVVRKNFAEDRLQLIFDEKPDEDLRSILKKNGFKWSPRFGAWQRQLTQNAIWTLDRLFETNKLSR